MCYRSSRTTALARYELVAVHVRTKSKTPSSVPAFVEDSAVTRAAQSLWFYVQTKKSPPKELVAQ